MLPLRGKVPVRRLIPSRSPRTNWALHKADLKEDFNEHCAYCDSYDGFRHTFFEVDHFVPKDLITKNGWGISLVQYSNLVYSCKFCNNSKLAIWPSNSPTVFHRYNQGFLDPCDVNFDTHFYRTNNGEIRWRTRLGKWMYSNAFKFDERIDGIKLLWNFNRIRKALVVLKAQRARFKNNSRNYNAVTRQIEILSAEYEPVHEELIDYYNNL